MQILQPYPTPTESEKPGWGQQYVFAQAPPMIPDPDWGWRRAGKCVRVTWRVCVKQGAEPTGSQGFWFSRLGAGGRVRTCTSNRFQVTLMLLVPGAFLEKNSPRKPSTNVEQKQVGKWLHLPCLSRQCKGSFYKIPTEFQVQSCSSNNPFNHTTLVWLYFPLCFAYPSPMLPCLWSLPKLTSTRPCLMLYFFGRTHVKQNLFWKPQRTSLLSLP